MLLEFVPNLPLCLPHRLLNHHSPGTHSLSGSVSQKSFLCSNFIPFYLLKCVQGAKENELVAMPMPCRAFLSLVITVALQRHRVKQTLWSDCWLSRVRLLFHTLIFFYCLFFFLFVFSCFSSPSSLFFPSLPFLSAVSVCSFYLLSCFLPSIFILSSPLLLSPASILVYYMSF